MCKNVPVPPASSHVRLKKDVKSTDLTHISFMYRLGVSRILYGYLFCQYVTSGSRILQSGWWSISLCKIDSNLLNRYGYLLRTDTVLIVNQYITNTIAIYNYDQEALSECEALYLLRRLHGKSKTGVLRNFTTCSYPSMFEILSPELREVAANKECRIYECLD